MTNEKMLSVVADKFGQGEHLDLFSQLFDCYDFTAEDILTGGDEVEEAIDELADTNVSVYDADCMDWLKANKGRADQKEAIALGAESVEKIAAYCWLFANREDLNEAIEAVRDANA